MSKAMEDDGMLDEPSPGSFEAARSDEAVATKAPVTVSDFECPICFDLVFRPCALECGFVVCEACLARSLQHALSRPSWSIRGAARSCPVLGKSCRYGPVQRLPGVQTVLHNHLATLFPEEYQRRLQEDEGAKEDVEEVRRLLGPPIAGACSGVRGGGGGGDAVQQGWGWRPFWVMGWLEPVLRQVREDVEGLNGLMEEPAGQLPRAPPEFDRWRLVLKHVLPWMMTGLAVLLLPSHPGLQAVSGTGFAQSFLVKPLGHWDLGLLTTCAGRSPFYAYEIPAEAAADLLRPRSFVLSRILWPMARLQLAASMDWYHRVVATHYIVSWSLTTLYLTAYCILHRVRRRRQSGLPVSKVLLREAGLLGCLVLVTELWNVLWWWVCRVKFRSFQCALDYRVAPSNVIESAILHLCLELVFIVSLFVGPSISPEDSWILSATSARQPREGWETDLQATVLTRFSLMFIPPSLLHRQLI